MTWVLGESYQMGVQWPSKLNSTTLYKTLPVLTDKRIGAEAPLLQPPDAKSRLMGKDPDAGKD